MKAFLLSAGLGTRLKPLTDDIPKCLVEVCGKPLLYIWLDLLERDGVDEVLINTHYFADKVEEAVMNRDNKIKVKLFYEEELHGSGGTVLVNEDFVRNEKDFFFIFADNLSNVSLNKIYDFHVSNDSLFTTYVYKTDVPKQKGIFVADDSGKVLDFEEKPEFPKSNLASAGIGVLSSEVFKIFNSGYIVTKLQSDGEKSGDKVTKLQSDGEKNSDEVTKLQSDGDGKRSNYEFGIMNDEFKAFTIHRGGHTEFTEESDFSGKEQKGKSGEVIDFGKDVMPMLIGNMYVMETIDYIRDIGTMKDLEEAREEFFQLRVRS